MTKQTIIREKKDLIEIHSHTKPVLVHVRHYATTVLFPGRVLQIDKAVYDDSFVVAELSGIAEANRQAERSDYVLPYAFAEAPGMKMKLRPLP